MYVRSLTVTYPFRLPISIGGNVLQLAACSELCLERTSVKSTSVLFSPIVLIKSKLQHPPLGNPQAFEYWEIFVQIPPPRAEKLFKCPQPRENYQITVFNFSVTSIMLPKLCMKHRLLDNTLYTCHEILGIFHVNTSSQTSSMNSLLLHQ